MIEVIGLTKNFAETRALNNLSFTVHDGVAFGLLGRNGAGKTTSIRIIMDIFRPDSGEVLIDGKPNTKGGFKIGYLPEERGLYQKRTILEQMTYIGQLRGLTHDEAVGNSKIRLEELEATEYLNRKLDTLSKGNQQKIQLAIALINDPDIVILDEPFSGLDPVNAQLLKDMVRRQVDIGKTVIFSSHQMSQVEEFCDNICIINKGENILDGNLSDIKKSYPRNIIYVEAETKITEDTVASIRSKMGESCKNILLTDRGCEVTISESNDREVLFNAFSEIGKTPEIFSVKEPSLEDIFVEKVGPSTEADEERSA